MEKILTTPRYIKQRDSFRCVPHAIVNALKWAGFKPNSKELITQLCQELQTRPGYGTRPGAMHPVMRRHLKGALKIGPRQYRPSLDWLRKQAEKGCAFFMVHKLPFDELMHMSFIAGRQPGGFVVVNSFIDDIKKTQTELFVSDEIFVERVINKNKHPVRGNWAVIPLEKF